jgi:bacillithiol biosynthesis deacetylase BshB1
MPDVKLDVLAIAAHPDDIEITCGGTLIKLAKRGRAVGALDLTRGEMGTRGDEHDREKEAFDAARIMGLAFRGNVELPDAAVENNQESRYAVAAFIRALKPEMVILPHWEQRHPDHLACSKLGYDACYLAGLKKLPIEGEPHRPRKILYASYFRNIDHSFLVDISGEFEKKCEAVAAYKSQFGSAQSLKEVFEEYADRLTHTKSGADQHIFTPGINIYDLMHTRARALGQLVRVQYAEAFTVKERILIDDPLMMPVASV